MRSVSSSASAASSSAWTSRYAGEGVGQLGPAERVEDLAVLVGALEAPLVGLPVHGDEVLGEVGEHPDRRGPAADVGPRAAVALHGADEDEAVGGVGAGLLGAQQGRVPGRQGDVALDHRAGGPGPHERRSRRGRRAAAPGR